MNRNFMLLSNSGADNLLKWHTGPGEGAPIVPDKGGFELGF